MGGLLVSRSQPLFFLFSSTEVKRKTFKGAGYVRLGEMGSHCMQTACSILIDVNERGILSRATKGK